MFSVVYRLIGAVEKLNIFLLILILLSMPAVGSFSEYSNQDLNENTLIKAHVTDVILAPVTDLQGNSIQAPIRDNGYNYTDVLVVYNENSALSIQIAQYFQNARNIPNINMCNITTSTSETVDRSEFQNIRTQIESYLDENNLTDNINYIVTTKEVPLRVSGGTNDRACLDNELALIKGQYQGNIAGNGWLINPYFEDDEPFTREKYDLYLVTRLTGFTWPEIKGLIDNATISQGKRGTYVLDVDAAKGYTGGYGIGNVWLRDANTILTAKGEQTYYDNTNTFVTGQTNVMGYASWGSNDGHDSVNYLLNPGFEVSTIEPTNWEILNDSGVIDNISINNSVRYANQRSIMINRTSISSNISGIAQNITPISGQRYYLTGWVNITSISGPGGAHLQFQMLDASDNIIKVVNSNFRSSVTNGWVSFSQRLYEPNGNVTKIRILAILNQSSGVAFFDQITFYGITPHNYWIPGSIAETFVSTGGRSFNYGTSYGQSLVADLIRDGVTGVKGYVYEPYLSAIAHPDILFDRYTDGYNLAESYYMASNFLSWMDVVVGDPKMAPYSDRITDLNISEDGIKFTPQTPNEGQEISFECTVYNLGNNSVETLVVKTYMITDSDEILINEKTITDIDANIGAEKIQFIYTPDEVLGDVTIKVIVDPDNKIKETDENNNVAEKNLHINFAPVTLDLKIQNNTIYRTDKFILYSNSSDIDNAVSELTPILEFKHEDRSIWSTFDEPQIKSFYNLTDARWQFKITTNTTMDIGKYSFRLHFLDDYLASSNYVFLHDVMLLNNPPNIKVLQIDNNQIYRNESIRLNCVASDIETITEELIIKMQYQYITTEGSGKGWIDIVDIQYDAQNESWLGTLKFESKAKTGNYQFRAWAIDADLNASEKVVLKSPLTVYNNWPTILNIEADKDSVLRTQPTEIYVTGFDLEDKNKLNTLSCEINYTFFSEEFVIPLDWLPSYWESKDLKDIEYDFSKDAWHTTFTPSKEAMIGYYLVRARIMDSDGAWSAWSLSEKQIQVINNPPIAKQTITPELAEEDEEISFDAKNSQDIENELMDLEFHWEIISDSESIITSSNQSFTYSLVDKGEYLVLFKVMDEDGGINWDNGSIIIKNVKPTAQLTKPTITINVDEEFEISAEESTDSESDIKNLTYTWDFGDGTTATGITTNHSYPEAKTYTISLTVTDDDGDFDTTQTTIKVYPLDEPKKPVVDDNGEGSSIVLYVGIATIIIIIIIIILFLLLRKRKQTKKPPEPEQPPIIQEPIPQQYMPMQQETSITPTQTQTMYMQPEQQPQPTVENIPLEEKTTTEELTSTTQESFLTELEKPPLLPKATHTTEIEQPGSIEERATEPETNEIAQPTQTEVDEKIQKIETEQTSAKDAQI